jgi:hypothetical protein
VARSGYSFSGCDEGSVVRMARRVSISLAAVLLLALVGLPVGPASANSKTIHDPMDAKDKSVDIESATALTGEAHPPHRRV